MNGPHQASVVVCSRGRDAELTCCLESLAGQEGLAEILVVENGASHARTRSIAEAGGARYLQEPRVGSGPARSRGLRAATRELVAYLDDDCIAEPGWLPALLQPFDEGDVHAVSGQVLPLELVTPAQQLLERYFPYSKGSRRRTFGPGPLPYPFPLNANEMGTGANMAFRRQSLLGLGGFVAALSAGGPAYGGEDIHALYTVLRAGHRLVYEPAARVRHHHPATLGELEHLFFRYGVAHLAYLTHCLLVDRDPRALRRAAAVLVHYARRSARPARSDPPRKYLLRHLAGSLLGPAAYVAARLAYG